MSLGILLLLLSVLFSRIVGESNISWLKYGNLPGLLYLAAYCGSIGVMWIVKVITGFYNSKVLMYIGKKSLIIMGTHMSLYLTVLSALLLSKVGFAPSVQDGVVYYLYGLLCVVIMLAIERCGIIAFTETIISKVELLLKREK